MGLINPTSFRTPELLQGGASADTGSPDFGGHDQEKKVNMTEPTAAAEKSLHSGHSAYSNSDVMGSDPALSSQVLISGRPFCVMVLSAIITEINKYSTSLTK